MIVSAPFTVRVTGAVLEIGEGSNSVDAGNYTYYYDDEIPPVIYCKSGLVLPSGNTSFLGGWYFNNQLIGDDHVNCPAMISFAAPTPSSYNPGALPLVECDGFQLHLQSEGLYTCRILDIDFQLHVFQVGIYFRRTSSPNLSGPYLPPDTNYTLGATLNVDCLTNGPPPDQLIITRNDVVVDENFDRIAYNTTASQHFVQYTIPSLSPDDYGVYTCTYVSPVFSGGSRSNSISIGGPTIPPQNFTAISITSESFTLSWTLIPGFQPSGLQIGYDIVCNPGNYTIMVNGSVSSVTVTGLLSYTVYSCTIFGYSQLIGPVSNPLSIITLQAGSNSSEGSDRNVILAVAVVFIALFLISMTLLLVLSFYQWRLRQRNSGVTNRSSNGEAIAEDIDGDHNHADEGMQMDEQINGEIDEQMDGERNTSATDRSVFPVSDDVGSLHHKSSSSMAKNLEGDNIPLLVT